MFPFKSIVVFAALVAGAASYADETLTREEVGAETARASAAGEMDGVNEAWDGTAFGQHPASGVYGRPFAEPGQTREAVMAEFVAVRHSREFEEHKLIYATGGD